MGSRMVTYLVCMKSSKNRWAAVFVKICQFIVSLNVMRTQGSEHARLLVIQMRRMPSLKSTNILAI